MPRTTVNVDARLLADARAVLGTTGVSDTVNAALEAARRRARLARVTVADFDITDDDIATARADRNA